MRTIPHDIVLRGYIFPKDTAFTWSYMLIGKDPKLFPEPGKLK